jgi:RHS repeat-associated protein
MATTNPFRFSTKYQDDETDLLYYGYRFYNAHTGRWISRDPVEELNGSSVGVQRNNHSPGKSANLYAACGNSLVWKWDFLGLKPCPDGIHGCDADSVTRPFPHGRCPKTYQGMGWIGRSELDKRYTRCEYCRCSDTDISWLQRDGEPFVQAKWEPAGALLGKCFHQTCYHMKEHRKRGCGCVLATLFLDRNGGQAMPPDVCTSSAVTETTTSADDVCGGWVEDPLISNEIECVGLTLTLPTPPTL